jgi:phosphomannomutase
MKNTEKKQRFGISGYRGVWGKNLTEEITFQYALAFAKTIKEKGGSKILIARDARPTGSLMFEAIKSAFEKEKLGYEYLGILPTPSVLLLVKKLSYDGGIMITASHNPAEYNGFKFFTKEGMFISPEEIDEIEKIKSNLEEKEKYQKNMEVENEVHDNTEFRKIHINEILKNIDTDLIKSKKFKVALDSINSAGSIITRELLEELGCDIFQINGKQDGDFTHIPEPRPENLGEIGQVVLQNKTDIGFAQDPDADRLVLIDEKGKVLSEEYTLALTFKSVLREKGGSVVMNTSTSSVNEEVALTLGAKVYRAKVGDYDVLEKVKEVDAIIGGEGGGGIIYPKINLAEDSLVGIGLILELLARENKKVSEIADSLPKYFQKKEKTAFLGNLDSIYKNVKGKFPDASADELEGLRLDWADHSWIQIRPSNTEPIIRIYGEAKSLERIESLFKDVMPLVSL